jgi:DNA modification methylase
MFQVKSGDLWGAGPHKIMCGSSISEADVSRLLAGERPRNMITDPPYGVGYAKGAKPNALAISPYRSQAGNMPVAGDNTASWLAAWQLAPCDVAYVWHAGLFGGTVQTDLEESGFDLRAQIIWTKPSSTFGQGHYHWQHEACFYAVRHGKTAEWIGGMEKTVWPVPRDRGYTHPTQKPVELFARALRHHKGDVFDPFAGSGTAIEAAHREGRKAFVMEISPLYVGKILERCERLGMQPFLIAEKPVWHMATLFDGERSGYIREVAAMAA